MNPTSEVVADQTPVRWIRPMAPRDRKAPHRASTPLELFFDLVFVVAVAQAASILHHTLAEGHIGEALVSYILIFFALWWSWVNFTWFASAYDNDDILYRITVFVQMTGALIVAAGLEGLAHLDFRLTVVGYVVMRAAMVFQWLRAARDDKQGRTTAIRFAIGLTVVQLLWIGIIFVPANLQLIAFFLLVALDISIPFWAERARRTAWHPHHIAERYGLFTIIVLGETVLASFIALENTLSGGSMTVQIAAIAAGALLTVFCMWWLYFMWPAARVFHGLKSGFIFGYGHIFVFMAAAAVGAGIGVVLDEANHRAELTQLQAGLAFALPVAVFILAVWALLELPLARRRLDQAITPIFACAIVACAWLPQTVAIVGTLLVVLVILLTTIRPELSDGPHEQTHQAAP